MLKVHSYHYTNIESPEWDLLMLPPLRQMNDWLMLAIGFMLYRAAEDWSRQMLSCDICYEVVEQRYQMTQRYQVNSRIWMEGELPQIHRLVVES